jgi:NitT/TauT family transport system substrate-binding protein
LKKSQRRSVLRRSVFVLWIILFPAVVASQNGKIVFAPQWLPQAQFAGYYVAQEQGFYKEAGLDVEIIHPSAAIQNTAMLSAGKADLISLFLISGLSLKINGIDMVNIGQISNHSALLFVTKKSNGISDISQLNGKKIAIWKSGFDEVPKAMMADRNIKVEWIPVLSTINLFMMNAVDAMTVMLYNEYDQIVNCGLDQEELNVFRMADYGYDIPEDGLYCSWKTFETRKSDLNKFLIATMKGWQYASENREYAVNIVIDRMEKEHVPANRAHQTWMLDTFLEMIKQPSGYRYPGYLPEIYFNKAAEIVARHNIGKKICSFTDFYMPVADSPENLKK